MAKNKRNDNHGELSKVLLRLCVIGETREVATEINTDHAHFSAHDAKNAFRRETHASYPSPHAYFIP